MKTLLSFALAALLSGASAAPALAAPPPANLTVFSESGQPFSLVLDGQLLTRPAAPQVRVGWLAPGRHLADISVATSYGPPVSFRTVVWLQPGRESDYMVVLRHWGAQLEPVTAAPASPGSGYYGPGNQGNPGGYYGGVPAPTGPGGYPAPVNLNGGYNSAPANPNGGYYPNGSYPGPNSPNGGYNPGGSSYPAPGNPAGSYPAPAYPGNGGSGYYPSPAGTYLRPLAPADLANLQQAIHRTSFDADKLSVAKQGLTQSSVRADELAGLVKALSFSDARVELATFGYAHVSDPQNFYQVYGALQFSSDVQKVRQNLNLP